ncbi:MAG TPA: patatin-like phospholipase family protein [Terriglobales bacterium]|nr:patatin-like phospholipase family protein [Terriglobales bacterium]
MKSRRSSMFSRNRRFFLCSAIAAIIALSNVAVYAQAQAQESKPQAQQSAQNQPGTSRPKIGIALEGGGALGLAHIGVLQWFEDHHIPIDYLAGTSMGGLVGGLYATGKSPQELQELVKEQKWDIIIGGQIPYEDLSYRRKEDLRAIQNSIKLGLKHGLSTPSGLNSGSEITLLIDRETLAYPKLDSFDSLPIPFRCVATDLVSGKEVVFSNGSLQQALRATMSIPGVFSPVRDGEKIYVDGGLVGNLPTDVVRKMGADIVIAIHLEVAPGNPKEIQSLFSVLGRSVDVVVLENELRGMKGADIVVTVELQKYNSFQYDRANAIIQEGTQAAEGKKQVLLPFAISDTQWNAYVAAKNARVRTDVPAPQFVKVEGTSPQAARQIETFLQRLVGHPVDNAEINQLLTRLTGIGKYASADYRVTSRDSQTGLLVTVHEYSYAPPILQLGFGIDGSESDDVTFTQLARITLMDVWGYRSEWRTDVQLGNTYGVQTELYRPFTTTSKWFFAPRGEATDASFKIFHKSTPEAIYRLYRDDVGIDIGYGFSRFTEVRAGYEVGYFDPNLRLGTALIPPNNGRFGDMRLRFLTDHRDDFITPRRGYSAQATFRWYDTNPGARDPFPVIEAQAEYFVPITKPGSIFIVAQGGSTFGSNNIGAPQFFLGGPSRLSAYGTNELFGNQYYYFRAGYLHEILTLPPFVGRNVYVIGAYEFGKMYDDPTASKLPNDAAVGFLAETAVGPLFIGGSVGDTGHAKWFFELGHVF